MPYASYGCNAHMSLNFLTAKQTKKQRNNLDFQKIKIIYKRKTPFKFLILCKIFMAQNEKKVNLSTALFINLQLLLLFLFFIQLIT